MTKETNQRDLTGEMIAMVKVMTSEERKEWVAFMHELIEKNKGRKKQMTIAEGIRKEFDKLHDFSIQEDLPFGVFESADALAVALNKYGFDLKMDIRNGRACFTPIDRNGNEILCMNHDISVIMEQIAGNKRFQEKAVECRTKGKNLHGLLDGMAIEDQRTFREKLNSQYLDDEEKDSSIVLDLENVTNSMLSGVKSAYGLLDAVMDHCFDYFNERDAAVLSSLEGISQLLNSALKDGEKATEIIDFL